MMFCTQGLFHKWGVWSPPANIQWGSRVIHTHYQMGQMRACVNCNCIQARKIKLVESCPPVGDLRRN